MGLESYKYDPESGLFYNRKGKQVGSYTRVYGRLFHRNKTIYLARLAIFLTTGSWPEEQVDHINGDTHDNRWINLRVCSREDNMCNRRKYRTNKSGFKGVFVYKYKDTDYYQASIQINKELIYLGRFDTKELAALAYDAAAKEHHGEFASLNFN